MQREEPGEQSPWGHKDSMTKQKQQQLGAYVYNFPYIPHEYLLSL